MIQLLLRSLIDCLLFFSLLPVQRHHCQAWRLHHLLHLMPPRLHQPRLPLPIHSVRVLLTSRESWRWSPSFFVLPLNVFQVKLVVSVALNDKEHFPSVKKSILPLVSKQLTQTVITAVLPDRQTWSAIYVHLLNTFLNRAPLLILTDLNKWFLNCSQVQ